MSDDSTFDLGQFAKDMIEGVAETVEKTVDQIVPDAPIDKDVFRSTGGTLGSTYEKEAFEPLDQGFMSAPTVAPAPTVKDLGGTDEDAIREELRPEWFDADAPSRLLEEIDHTVNEVVPQFVEDLLVDKDISDIADEMRFEPEEPELQGFKQIGGDEAIDEYRHYKLLGGIDPVVDDPDTYQWKPDGLKDDGLADEQWKLDGLKLDGLKEDGLEVEQQWKFDGSKDDGFEWKFDGSKADGLEVTLSEGAVDQASVASFIPDVAVTPSPAGPIPVPYPNVSESPRDVASQPVEATPIDPPDDVAPLAPREADFDPVEVDFDPVDHDAVDAVWSGLTDDAPAEPSADDATPEWGE